MKPAPFEYVRAASAAEACRLLAEGGADAKLVAGGQSLVPMMAMRLARPGLLIDIARVEELQGTGMQADVLRVGAATRQCVLERDRLAREQVPLLGKALGWVGHAQTRNRGTIGGSIVHADPSAELALVACVLDVILELQDAAGVTEMPAREFFRAPMVTAIDATQCLVGIRFPAWQPGRTGCAFDELSIRHGDFALASACAQVALGEDGRCARAEIGIGGAASVPLALPEIAALLHGTMLDDRAIDDAAAAAADAIDPEADLHASAEYRRHLARVLVARALRSARDDAMQPEQVAT